MPRRGTTSRDITRAARPNRAYRARNRPSHVIRPRDRLGWRRAWLAAREVGGGGLAGVGGAAQEASEQFELGVVVSGADLIQRGVHPGVEPVQVGTALAQWPDRDRAAVGPA